MSKSDEQWLFLQDVAKLIEYAKSINIKLTGGELYRTKYQQEKYVADGKSKTMHSKHLERLAIDFNFFVDGELTYEVAKIKKLGEFWESLNEKNEAGMFWKWKDVPHFQRNA